MVAGNTPQRSALRNDGYQISRSRGLAGPPGRHDALRQRDGAGYRGPYARALCRALPQSGRHPEREETR